MKMVIVMVLTMVIMMARLIVLMNALEIVKKSFSAFVGAVPKTSIQTWTMCPIVSMHVQETAKNQRQAFAVAM